MNKEDEIKLLEIIRDLVPYALPTIGRLESSWPYDSVILRARRALREHKFDE